MPNTKYKLIVHDIVGISHDNLKQRSIDDENLNYSLKLSSDSLLIEFENTHRYPYMVLPIFYHEGWNLKINNQNAPIINTNNGMIGFNLPNTDELVIELNYMEKGIIPSIMISLLSLVVLLSIDRNPVKRLKNKKIGL